VTESRVKNLPASVKARLANLALEQKEDFQELLSRYGRERLLCRLSVSEYRERFILKGALLFAYWTGAPHRPTRDIVRSSKTTNELKVKLRPSLFVRSKWNFT